MLPCLVGLLALQAPAARRPRPSAASVAVRPLPPAPKPVFDQMAELAENHYLPLAAAQMGAVRMLSDAFGQAYATYHEVPLRWVATVVLECSNAGCESSFHSQLPHAPRRQGQRDGQKQKQ